MVNAKKNMINHRQIVILFLPNTPRVFHKVVSQNKELFP